MEEDDEVLDVVEEDDQINEDGHRSSWPLAADILSRVIQFGIFVDLIVFFDN